MVQTLQLAIKNMKRLPAPHLLSLHNKLQTFCLNEHLLQKLLKRGLIHSFQYIKLFTYNILEYVKYFSNFPANFYFQLSKQLPFDV